MSKLLWTPPENRVRNSRMTDFAEFAGTETGRAFPEYADLYQWSVDNIADFWQYLWEFSRLIYTQPYTSVLDSSGMFGAVWFEGARLNFAENLLRYRDDKTAIIYQTESGVRQRMTYAELHDVVAAIATGLRKLGVTEGDRVAGFMTNRPEAIIAMLAATSIGAIWSSCSPDFGFKGVFDRFSQIEPKILFTIDGYHYGGKIYSTADKVRQLTESIPAIEKVIIVSDLKTPSPSSEKVISFTALAETPAATIEFTQLPFNHPVYIMYSSGTTGLPKCMVHGAGGTLLQHFKELALHTNLDRDDVITYYTTCGWMMWNWLVSSLMIGATIYLYNGHPAYSDYHILWQAIENEKITIFGTSPKYLTGCRSAGLSPGREHDLSSLKTILSTGAPLSDDDFDFVYSHVKKDVQLSSISGGTDIISCFMLGNPNLPVYSGEIQCRGLGMKVETFDDEGHSVKNQVGELVCTEPFPSMPAYFWNDPKKTKYINAYFNHFPGVWRHGDYIKITENGGIIVYGRSDATLNRAGVRIGTAEIYAPVESLDEIEDSIVIAQDRQGDSRIILFVVLGSGVDFGEALEKKINDTIRRLASPRHVPDLIVPVSQIPHTINGKKVELAVAKIINGREISNREALANPEALAEFERIRDRLAEEESAAG